MSSDEQVEVEGEVLRETEKAYHFEDGNVKVWLPKSLVEWDAAEKVMTMPEWLATREGLA